MAKIVFPNEKSYKLDNLAALLDIKIPNGRHTALIDSIITGSVFIKLLERTNISTIDELLEKSCVNKDKKILLN